ncbi:hypothetical protein [Heliophilum fasciatum]|uniref:Uncharacterized protein n=1 Tax=Heliophilum fasciatum TaxID=35700 RepID=A0A4R2RQU8_9FIRM|nr:hypothetical protein [Heliophilum fasciatum]MCW2277561.1 hypothetical protein [Heliophilum fasciatum]TCP65149.1 hypothetical protein EDD73_10627 [Heliophilum fasciatum]
MTIFPTSDLTRPSTLDDVQRALVALQELLSRDKPLSTVERDAAIFRFSLALIALMSIFERMLDREEAPSAQERPLLTLLQQDPDAVESVKYLRICTDAYTQATNRYDEALLHQLFKYLPPLATELRAWVDRLQELPPLSATLTPTGTSPDDATPRPFSSPKTGPRNGKLYN